MSESIVQLLSDCKDRIWLMSNTLAVCASTAPPGLRHEIRKHLSASLELQKRIEEELK